MPWDSDDGFSSLTLGPQRLDRRLVIFVAVDFQEGDVEAPGAEAVMVDVLLVDRLGVSQ